MQRYIIRRILQGILTLFGLSIVVFLLARVVGDPAELIGGIDASLEEIQQIEHDLGLDKPLPNQYWIFIRDAATGDFGESIYYHEPATEVVMDHFPATLKLSAVAFTFALALGILLGVISALKKDKASDSAIRLISVAGMSLPAFWTGLMMMLLFAVEWELLPAAGMGGPKHYILPATAMSLPMMAGIARLVRSSMLEVLGSEYITFARARGIPERSLIMKHAFKNASIPVLTFASMMMITMMMGAVVVETVFNWPGIGRLAYESVVTADFPVLQTIVLLFGTLFIVTNLLVDILYGQLDPRIRYQ